VKQQAQSPVIFKQIFLLRFIFNIITLKKIKKSIKIKKLNIFINIFKIQKQTALLSLASFCFVFE